MRIGEFADRSGLTTRQIRYWSQCDLLQTVRTPSGYRDYNPSDIHKALRIRDMLAAGLTVRQISRLSSCLDYDGGVCVEERQALQNKADELNDKIACLTRTRAMITQVLKTAKIIEKPLAQSAAQR